jgi:hypothetical protein
MRAIAAAAAEAAHGAAAAPPQLQLHPHAARLGAAYGLAQPLQLRNAGPAPVAFSVAGPPPFGALPSWLDATPAAGVVPAGGAAEIVLRASPQQPQWAGSGQQAVELSVTACPVGGPAAAAWPVGGALAGHWCEGVRVVLQ